MCRTLWCDLAPASFPLNSSAPASLQPKANLHMSAVSRQWGRNCLWLWPWKTGRAEGWTLRGFTEEVRGQLGKGWQKSSAYEAYFIVPVRAFFLPEKKKKKEKCSSGIVQRLMAALPGMQFSKYADAIPFEFQHNRVVKNADSSDARLLFPFSYLSQAVSLRHIKSTHS